MPPSTSHTWLWHLNQGHVCSYCEEKGRFDLDKFIKDKKNIEDVPLNPDQKRKKENGEPCYGDYDAAYNTKRLPPCAGRKAGKVLYFDKNMNQLLNPVIEDKNRKKKNNKGKQAKR